jgi:hypothetical protein
MVGWRANWWAYGKTLVLCLVTLSPFAPGAWVFVQRGIPEVLLAGDGAALELGTLHAAAGTQLLGPYSRFGWNHPGPAFFYLALPIYELCDRRGSALNLFAFMCNAVVAILIVREARRLRGTLFAMVVAALLAVFSLVGLPFLLANQWNPILPILPLGFLFFLAVRLAVGARDVLPVFALVASIVVQTHVAYAPAVLALCVIPLANQVWGAHAARPSTALNVTKRWNVPATIGVLVLSWGLPLYEMAVNPPGNLIRVMDFFASGASSSHSWATASRTVADQMAIMPWAILQVATQQPLAAPGASLTLGIAATEVLGLIALLVFSARRQDQVAQILCRTALIQVAVAIMAVKAIRGDIHSYLVAWVSLTGFWFLVTATACVLPSLIRALGATAVRAIVTTSALLLVGLALSAPIPRSAVIDESNLQAEQIAPQVEAYLTRSDQETPTLRIVSPDAWPIAVAVVLYLHKHNMPIFVERQWLHIVGQPFAEPQGRHPVLLFGDEAFAIRARGRADLLPVAQTARFSVFLTSSTSAFAP